MPVTRLATMPLVMMRVAAIITLALTAAPPARASTGLACEGVDSEVAVSVLLGSGLVRTPLAARLVDARGERRTAGPGQPPETALVIGQSWLDRTEFRLDVLDVEGRAYEGRLRVGFAKDGPVLASGILILGEPGRIVEVECEAD